MGAIAVPLAFSWEIYDGYILPKLVATRAIVLILLCQAADAVQSRPISGIDIAPRQVELAAEQLSAPGNVRIVAGDIQERLDYPNDHFDAVVGNSVLHHVDLDRALPELFRVLKPGGRFVFFEPNMLNPQIALERNVGFIGRRLMNSPDETAFVRWRLRARLAAAGFRQIDVRRSTSSTRALPPGWSRS